jgi:hypothetical protein
MVFSMMPVLFFFIFVLYKIILEQFALYFKTKKKRVYFVYENYAFEKK